MNRETERKTQICSRSHLNSESKKRGFATKIFTSTTVEPSLMLCILSSTMYQIITINLFLEKTCRVQLALNDTVCNALSERRISGYEVEETRIQNYVAEMSAISTFIQGLFPFCLLLFLGSWSDKHNSRKPLILAPILGEIVAVILLILNTVYFEEIPVIFAAFSVSLPSAVMGGWPCLFLGVYSHISSLTDDDNKTSRIGLSSTIQNVAFIIGLGSSGFLLAPFGFIGIYIICLIMLIFSFLCGYLMIKENTTTEMENRKNGITTGRFHFLHIFRLEHLKNTVKTCFVGGRNDRKKKILIILLLCIITLGPMQGENAVCYLYTRLKFGWNELDFSIFFLTHSFVDIIGSSITIVILSKIFKWKDSSIGVLALCTTIIAEVIYGFASNSKYFYVGIIPDIFFTVPPIALRSLMAKTVPESELGRSNSVLGLSEALVPLIFGPIYSTVYKNTMKNFPGSFYFLSISMYSIAAFLFIYLHRQSLRDPHDVEENVSLRNSSEKS